MGVMIQRVRVDSRPLHRSEFHICDMRRHASRPACHALLLPPSVPERPEVYVCAECFSCFVAACARQERRR
jgi:hypothetical protein